MNKLATNHFFYLFAVLFLMPPITLLTGCDQIFNNERNAPASSIKTSEKNQTLSGEKWLQSIFECSNGDGYCLPDEKKIFTTQYYDYYLESLEIFEYPEFETEMKKIDAENAYKDKWEKIYPLGKSVWAPFGRGNGMETGHKINNVTITRASPLEYNVLVDYGEGMVFNNSLSLVSSNDVFLIDYIKTISVK